MKQPQPHVTINIPKRAFLPCYQHLLNIDTDIDLLYGGRDSGKSRDIAQMLVVDCLRQTYFRCVMLRKVFNSVKESMWQTIKDVVEEWGIEHLFVFNITPLEIRCVNGNKFVCRGMDDPGNLKSIANFNYAWIEEGNQLDMDDFILLMTSLRYNKGRAKTYISFNPEAPGNYDDFWLYKTFYADIKDPYIDFTRTWTIDVGNGKVAEYKYSSTHTTYLDNKWCGVERIAFYNQLKNIDPYHYSVYTLGRWHNRSISDPFCYCFDKKKHIGPTIINPRQDVVLSFDFNINPITCGVYQSDGKKISVIESIKLENSDIYKLCDYVWSKYSKYLLVVTGDATGRNSSALVQDGINYYTVIKSKLNLSAGQLKVPSVNPTIKENRVLVNAVLYNLDVKMDPTNAKALIYDCENVSVGQTGDIEKGSRSNPAQRADHLDNFRYYLNQFHKAILRTP